MSITIRKPDDMHLHLRQGETLRHVLPWTANQFARAVVMPNTIPPITTTERLQAYRNEIRAAVPKGQPDFEPLMTFKIMADMNADRVAALKKAGAIAGKLYPRGSTTHAEDGPSDLEALFPVFAAMQNRGLVLSIHAEDPARPVLQREQDFLPAVHMIAETFPELKIVVEHVSSRETVDFVRQAGENIAGTVTLHHLLFTIDDILGGSLDPHLFCKPLIKSRDDREAIRGAAFSGNERFFFGSDSAPHSREKKLNEGAAGVFSAPVLLPALTGLFEEYDRLDLLENFLSVFGASFYGLELNEGTITLEKADFEVPKAVDEYVPILAGKKLNWRVKAIS